MSENKNSKIKTEIVQGGFSEPILQPIYLICIGTFYLLIPFLGVLTAAVTILIPAFVIALKVAEIQRVADMQKYNKFDEINSSGYLYIDYAELRQQIRMNNYLSPQLLSDSLDLTHRQAEVMARELIISGLSKQPHQKISHQTSTGSDRQETFILKLAHAK